MPRSAIEKLMRLLYREGVVYDLDTDSYIRECANNMSALALFSTLSRLDDTAPDFRERLMEATREYRSWGPDVLVGYDDGRWNGLPKGDDEGDGNGEVEEDAGHECYLKIIFSSNEAAYFAFSMWPYLDAHYVRGASRKRENEVHHVRLELERPENLDLFIGSLRRSHVVRVEASSEEIFNAAPSHGV